MSEGIVIDQRFRLGRVIRESGVAVVYEAKHRNGAEAWIKLPRTPEHGGALLAEARVANALGKKAVNLRDDGVTEDGLPYLVLEPVTGQRLDHWRQASGGRAPPDEAMGLGDELCQAIGTMHGAGFAVGVLRADAIIVLPKGGMCLLELEHVRPATPATVKEDVVRVGRVLYEMLSGMPCLAHGTPLHEAAPELPRPMTMTVDDAARGRFTTIAELRSALRASMPDWLGPRKPMPSVAPEAATIGRNDIDEILGGGPGMAQPSDPPARPADFDFIVLPRASRPLFDPRDLVDSSRNVLDAGEVREPAEEPSLLDRASFPSRPSDVSPVAAFAQIGPERSSPKPRGSLGLVIAGAAATLTFVGTMIGVVALFASRKSEIAPPPPAAKAASGAVMVATSEITPPASATQTQAASGVATIAAPPATQAPAASASAGRDMIEVDDAPAKAPAPGASVAASARPPSASDAPPTETSFRFEGDLSPRLVIVDGIVVGTTTKPVRVKCGTHSVKIGGKGVSRDLDLPCGGEQVLLIERNGKWRAE